MSLSLPQRAALSCTSFKTKNSFVFESKRMINHEIRLIKFGFGGVFMLPLYRFVGRLLDPNYQPVC